MKTARVKNTVVQADTLLRLLAAKHSGDVFVPECKTGSTYHGDALRMDAWVMAKSWANPCCTCYEIKVTRSDFIRDNKWQAYLPFCNAFYFVCPPNVIRTEEVPSDAGLMVCTSNATNLFTKKKAPLRSKTIDSDVFLYVLMWRAKIGRHSSWDDGGAPFWRDWVKGRAVDKDIGHRAGRKVATFLREKVLAVESRQRELEARLQTYSGIESMLATIGVDPEGGLYIPSIERRLRAIQDVIPKELERDAREAMGSIERLLSAIETARQPADEVLGARKGSA